MTLQWLNKGVRGELREGEGIIIPCYPRQIRGACAGICGLRIRHCGCDGLPRLEIHRCVAHKESVDSSAYWLTHPTPVENIARAITVRGVEKYWWSYGCALAHQKVLNLREEISRRRDERRRIHIDLEFAKRDDDPDIIKDLEKRLDFLNNEIRESKRDFKDALLDRSHKCCSECEEEFKRQVNYHMCVDIGRIQDSYYYQIVQDRVRRTLSGEICLPLPVINTKEVPCVVKNKTPDIFGTEDEEWSDIEEDESEAASASSGLKED